MVFSFHELLETVSPKFKDESKIPTYEILDYLNRTVQRYIKLKYLSGDTFKTNTFKLSQSPDDLALLVANHTDTPVLISPHAGIPYSGLFQVPSDFLAYIRSSTGITRTKPDSLAHATVELIPNIEIDFNDIDSIMTTPYNSPLLVHPVVTMANDHLVVKAEIMVMSYIVITDKYCTMVSTSLDYIKQPQEITTTGHDCELAVYLHEEIVKLAVSLYLDEYKLKLSGTQQTR